MAKKPRIGIRCYNPYVPNEVWDMFKIDLRKMFKSVFAEEKFLISVFYWQGFSVADEYIRVTPKNDTFSDWKKVWDVLDFVAKAFGMKIDCVYEEVPVFKVHKEDSLFKRDYTSYCLKNTRTWTNAELDDFISKHSFEELKFKFYEI